ncbi:MAG: hypothetical protein CEE40_08520 [Chloroflexi bacterium B3_Chlor]|nr:MAG: hypothetical protein CEE40_08520 [Chloroflexi bacterium B3_Chlor]
MVMERIQAMLTACDTELPPFPRTDLYNEGWLLRLVLDWCSRHNVPDHPLRFSTGARWYCEALLPSAFLARHKGDSLAEGWTHADGVMGHFEIGNVGKGDLSVLPDARQLVVLEAKMFSPLSPDVTHASYYDQAARTVACIAEVVQLADRHPSHLSALGFYVLAPARQIKDGVFAEQVDKASIEAKVQLRVKEWVAEHGDDKDQWHTDWFQPTLEQIDIGVASWEALISTIGEHDAQSADSIGGFYDKCVVYNS